MADRYPGYDVLDKRDTLSWNDATREVVAARLAIPDVPRFCTLSEWQTLRAVCARIAPPATNRPCVPTAALVDHKLLTNETDGYRNAALPVLREAWRRGLAALDAESVAAHGARFHRLTEVAQDALLAHMQQGAMTLPDWGNMSPALFFKERLAHDIVAAYYSHPTAWSEVGWGGPASPRGYVRMGFDRRDPWEPEEAHGDDAAAVAEINRRVR